MRLRRLRIIILAVVVALVGSSGIALAALSATPASLSQPTWTLFHLVVDGQQQPLSSSRLATLRFVPQDGHIEGTGGCRAFGGSYVVLESQLRMSVSRLAPLLCRGEAGVMEQELLFFQALPRVTSYHIDAALTLTLTSDDGRVALTFGAT